ncbi:MAG TPA: transglutaminase-like cysteine peptidase [Pseudolabrys sp.]|nr:transglutaminase-like cysteine peptidase [Pseudolabrys sp.]
MALRRVTAMTLGLVILIVLAADRKISLASTAQPAVAAQASADIRADVATVIDLSPEFEVKPAAFGLISLALHDSPVQAAPSTPAIPAPKNPYGLEASLAPSGALWTKWRTVQADIDSAMPAVDQCRKNLRRCSTAARRFVAIIRQAARSEGMARFAIVNRSVNAAIAYASDTEQWHKDDVWSAPITSEKSGTFQTGKGDCEDYAIAKYVALREAGVATDDLQILVVKDTAAKIDHAALAARIDGRWLLLDNRWSRLLEESETAFFMPLFAVSEAGVQRFDNGPEPVAARKPRPSPSHLRLAAANAR